MDAKLFKNFHTFVATVPDLIIDAGPIGDDLETHEAADPAGSQWRQMGFLPVEEGIFAIDVQGAATLACVQVNERILPGAVQREKMLDKINDIQAREGRKVGKKEYAQIKDEVVFELLPQAFIRRKLVPIMFVKDRVLVFTSSAKLCDDVVTLLVAASPAVAEMRLVNLASLAKNSITGSLTTLAKEGSITSDNDMRGCAFNVANGMVLKGEGKKTITIKDKDVQESDIQALLKQAYEVVKLRLDFIESGDDESATFTLNDNLVISAMLLKDVDFGREKDAADAAAKFLTIAWMTAKIAYAITSLVIEVMGGVAAEEETATVEDDDEL